MNAPAPRYADLRGAMPRTAQWVQEQRALLGDAWVTQCVKRGMAGEPGWFYAVEAGHVVGAPFAWGDADAALISRSLVTGAPFFGALRPAPARDEPLRSGSTARRAGPSPAPPSRVLSASDAR